jgi:hypothetical protein
VLILVFDLTFSLAAFSDKPAAFSDKPAALWRRSCEEGEEVPSWARMRRAVGEEVEEEGGMKGFWVMKTEPWGDDGSVEGAAGKRVGRRERNYGAEEGVSEILKVRSRREEGGEIGMYFGVGEVGRSHCMHVAVVVVV